MRGEFDVEILVGKFDERGPVGSDCHSFAFVHNTINPDVEGLPCHVGERVLLRLVELLDGVGRPPPVVEPVAIADQRQRKPRERIRAGVTTAALHHDAQ